MGKKTSKGLVIAIDGPGGVGKTTVSKMLAERLGLYYIDTGAMYRALALAAVNAGVDISSDSALEIFCINAKIEYDVKSGAVSVNGTDLTRLIRTHEVSRYASIASACIHVRSFLVAYQRGLAGGGSVVMEGRDIGTVVLPRADIKFFLDASHETRAERRHGEACAGGGESREDVSRTLAERDKRDASRKSSPLKKADDAVYIDTTSLDAEGVMEKMLVYIREKSRLADIHR